MSVNTRIAPWFSFGRQALVLATLAIATLGLTAPVVAQDAAENRSASGSRTTGIS